MAVDQTEKPKENQGLLGLGFKPGQPVPPLAELGIPSRVGEEGDVEWMVHGPIDFWLDQSYDFRSYLWRRRDWVLQAIFRAWNSFSLALLGYPVRLNFGGWPIESLPVPYEPGQIQTLWEKAPRSVQKIIFASALEYLKPQLSAQSHS